MSQCGKIFLSLLSRSEVGMVSYVVQRSMERLGGIFLGEILLLLETKVLVLCLEMSLCFSFSNNLCFAG